MRRPLTLVALASAAAAGLWVTGRSTLPGPPLSDPSAIARWWSREGPAIALFSLARYCLVGLGGAICVLSAGVLAAPAVLSAGRMGAYRSRHVAGWVARWGRTRGWRAAARLLLGVSASGAALATSAGRAAATGGGPSGAGPPPAPVLIGPATAASPATQAPRATTSPPTTVAPDAAAGSAPPSPSTSTSGPGLKTTVPSSVAPLQPAPREARTAAPPVDGIWLVRPGDNFWSIAEAVVSPAVGPPADARTVAAYWLRLIDANRSRLAYPDDPSLLFAGDLLTVPAP